MENILKALVIVDEEGQKIVQNARNEAELWERRARKKIESKIIKIRSEAKQQELEIAANLKEKIDAFTKRTMEELEKEKRMIDIQVEKNWENAIFQGLKVLEELL